MSSLDNYKLLTRTVVNTAALNSTLCQARTVPLARRLPTTARRSYAMLPQFKFPLAPLGEFFGLHHLQCPTGSSFTAVLLFNLLAHLTPSCHPPPSPGLWHSFQAPLPAHPLQHSPPELLSGPPLSCLQVMDLRPASSRHPPWPSGLLLSRPPVGLQPLLCRLRRLLPGWSNIMIRTAGPSARAPLQSRQTTNHGRRYIGSEKVSFGMRLGNVCLKLKLTFW